MAETEGDIDVYTQKKTKVETDGYTKGTEKRERDSREDGGRGTKTHRHKRHRGRGNKKQAHMHTNTTKKMKEKQNGYGERYKEEMGKKKER